MWHFHKTLSGSLSLLKCSPHPYLTRPPPSEQRLIKAIAPRNYVAVLNRATVCTCSVAVASITYYTTAPFRRC